MCPTRFTVSHAAGSLASRMMSVELANADVAMHTFAETVREGGVSRGRNVEDSKHGSKPASPAASYSDANAFALGYCLSIKYTSHGFPVTSLSSMGLSLLPLGWMYMDVRVRSAVAPGEKP